jgi:hypothetical protein
VRNRGRGNYRIHTGEVCPLSRGRREPARQRETKCAGRSIASLVIHGDTAASVLCETGFGNVLPVTLMAFLAEQYHRSRRHRYVLGIHFHWPGRGEVGRNFDSMALCIEQVLAVAEFVRADSLGGGFFST